MESAVGSAVGAAGGTIKEAAAGEDGLAALARETYLSLTTFRRNGTPVATTVWVVSDDGARLLVRTDATSGKVKRLRNNPNVRVAACSSRGVERGTAFDAVARVVDDASVVETLLSRKYGVGMRLVGVVKAFQRIAARRPKTPSVTLEIRVA